VLVPGQAVASLPWSEPESSTELSQTEWECVMTSKQKFGGLTIALGAALGAVLGAVTGQMGVWLAVGVAIGVALGVSMRPRRPECPQCEAMHRLHAAEERRPS